MKTLPSKLPAGVRALDFLMDMSFSGLDTRLWNAVCKRYSASEFGAGWIALPFAHSEWPSHERTCFNYFTVA